MNRLEAKAKPRNLELNIILAELGIYSNPLFNAPKNQATLSPNEARLKKDSTCVKELQQRSCKDLI